MFEKSTSKQKIKISIYYDGKCHLCSREMQRYQKKDHGQWLRFVDITENSFSAQQEGVPPQDVHKWLHVKDAKGNVFVAVEAFLAIWQVLPNYQWLVPIINHPWLRPFVDVLYRLFAQYIRPLLPKRSKRMCPTETCQRAFLSEKE